jgi:hypothetical protein
MVLQAVQVLDEEVRTAWQMPGDRLHLGYRGLAGLPAFGDRPQAESAARLAVTFLLSRPASLPEQLFPEPT